MLRLNEFLIALFTIEFTSCLPRLFFAVDSGGISQIPVTFYMHEVLFVFFLISHVIVVVVLLRAGLVCFLCWKAIHITVVYHGVSQDFA